MVAPALTTAPYADRAGREDLLLAVDCKADCDDSLATSDNAVTGSADGAGPSNGTSAVAYRALGEEGLTLGEVSPPLDAPDGGGREVPTVQTEMAVRRLMPIECERLQGFPDNYTAIPYRDGKTASDSPRYKALGNAMPVNVMRWIGRRIEMVEDLCKKMTA